MEEQTFLSLDDVKVTSARFIVPSQTFAMAGITSVKNSEQRPTRVYPIWCGIFGVVALIADAYAVGIGLLVLAAVWWIGQKTQYHVVLATAGGEMTALTSKDRAYISNVVKALNDSIVARG
ncbi:MAG: hypothetical protein HZY77_04940 [Thiobacillus sp.]|uniref:DUF6232 family protein n=1 Tax=Thiobacillus sp. TaxID=924 RepID=UPI00168C18D9|nr:DUF6232 family protein [Thiobacillus sp.]QLQ02289.1 MAG: hypothetical protein HZY77_04940 [Thiobacillus sp.]